jgi:hypothetical protein
MGNLNLCEEKFKICPYSLKLTTLIQTLNQNSKNPIDLNIIRKTIRYFIPLTMHREAKNVKIEFFKLFVLSIPNSLNLFTPGKDFYNH